MGYSLRQVKNSPGFFSLSALLLALGVAATTQIFTLVDALLLRPLPVRSPQNLVQLFEFQAKRPAEPYFSYRFYRALTAESSTLFDLTGQIDTTRSLERVDRAERIHAVAVTGNFFSNLGVPALLGRVLTSDDSDVAVLSYAYWSSSFGRDPKAVGQLVRLQGHPFRIVGVTPEAFTGTTVDSSPDIWLPFANQVEFSRIPNPNLDQYVIEIIARLRPGVSEAQAQRETAAVWARLIDPSDDRGLKRGSLQVLSIANGVSPLRDQARTALLLLQAGTGLLLLMVCANVGGLFLARATAREREMAIRTAVGASRAQIFRLWLLESLLLTAGGGVTGVCIAQASVPILMRWLPPAHGIGFDPAEVRALTLQPHLNLRVLAFSLAVCLLSALLCAVAPMWRSVRSSQAVLCGFQIALCTMLLISAGLLIRSLQNLRAADSGLALEHVTIFSIDPHIRGYDSQRTWSLEQRLLNGVRMLPGVQAAALADRALMRGIGLGTSVVFPGQRGGVVNSSMNNVTPEYFDVMGVHLLAGRNFHHTGGRAEVIVNQAFLRKFSAGLGQQFDTGQRYINPQYTIVGVVNDTKYRSLREVPPPIFYTDSYGPDAYPDTFILHVRSQGDPHAIIHPVRQLLAAFDPALPVYQVATLPDEVDRSLWQEHLLVALTCCFGVFALSLSAIGLYGILAYFVSRRQREIGLRLALGANGRQVAWLVASRVMPALAMGAVGGAALAWWANGWVRSLLYGVQPFDPLTTLAAVALLISIGIAGAGVPTLRAIRVDPAISLRHD